MRVVPLAILAAFLAQGCVSAKITVVDERTALENQILGSYEELDRDLQLLASVRETDAPGAARATPGLGAFRRQAVLARQTQQFNRDDLDELKAAGCLGEDLQAALTQRPCPDSADPAVAERIARLVASENEARRVLLNFIVAQSADLGEKDLPQIVSTYARMQRDQARSGEWIQEPGGGWIRVK